MDTNINLYCSHRLKKGTEMEKLNVRFPDVANLKINDIGEALDLFNSDIARAALFLGLEKLQHLAARDKQEAVNLVISQNVKNK